MGTGLARNLSPRAAFLWKTHPTPVRRAWYAVQGRQRALRRPVVSVGNISLGGRGKTPAVIRLAQILLDAGERPAILSRGYGRRRREDGVVVVCDGLHLMADLDRSGDEPLMIARAVPGAIVVVCEQRWLAGALAERALGATVHLLDDGFQHVTLARDVDLVVVAPEDLQGRPVPFGALREPSASLAAADAVIIDADGAAGADADPGRLLFHLHRRLAAPVPLEPDRPWHGGAGPVVAMAGIANPGRFTRALEAAGWAVARTLAFPDHHRYRASDLAAAATAVRDTGASAVLTTAKDAVRLLPLRPLPVAVAAVPLDVTIDPVDRFQSWLLARLGLTRVVDPPASA
jgi:tetraacyldisaccharide 4'-kinase